MPTNLYGGGDNYHPTNGHVLPALIDRFHSTCSIKFRINKMLGIRQNLEESSCMLKILQKLRFLLWKNGIPNENAPLDDTGEPLTWLNVGTGIDITIKELAEINS